MKTNSISAGLAVHGRTTATTRHRIFCRAWLWTSFLALATMAFGPQPAQAVVTEAWVNRYANSIDQARQVVLDAAGDVIVAGTTYDGITGWHMLIIKYSGSTGSVLWQERYNGPYPDAVAVDGNGNVVVTGLGYTVKYAAADGALLWEQLYRLEGPRVFSAIAVDACGNVAMTGPSFDEATGQWGYVTVKYAAVDGALLWESRYNTGFNWPRARVAMDGSDNVVVTGFAYYDAATELIGYSTVKYAAADGALLWENRYNAPTYGYVFAGPVAVDGNGNVVVTSPVQDVNNRFVFSTVKYAAADGALLWENRYNAPANDVSGLAMAVDGNDNVVVMGGGRDYYMAKYAADGALLWEKRYTNAPTFVTAITVDTSGNVVLIGGGGDYYTAKYAATDGALLWEKFYNGPANVPDYAMGVAVDASGNVVVTGISDFEYNDDYCTLKYAAGDGAVLWEQRYNGVSDHEDYPPEAVAVDSSGNVIETGNSCPGSIFCCYTAKYAAADGALLWEQRYLANNTLGWVTAMTATTVDTSDNVVVTGRAFNGTNTDYYTAKFAARDGALLWEKFFNGPANAHDGATAVAVDASGNVVVTGNSYGTNSSGDYYTAKYAAADGALLWEKFFNGPADANDEATVVAVDASGNAVVTGRSGSGSYTAKYAAADGALLWERRVKGPSSDNVYYHMPMAMDGDGNVVVMSSSVDVADIAKYAAADGALRWEKRINVGERAPLALDSSGNVVVVRYSLNGPPDSDRYYYATKYAAADGALLWEKPIINGLGNVAVAVDSRGNVVVAGTSPEGATRRDYSTAKYAAGDGAVLWEQRYNSPRNGDDWVGHLALGPNGMVVVTGRDPDLGRHNAVAYATVVYRELLPTISIDRLPTGVRLRSTGVPGLDYNIERAPAVTGPWSTINTQTAPASGLFEYLDTDSPAAAAFYRTSEL